MPMERLLRGQIVSLSKLGIPVKPSNVSGVEVTHYWQNLSEICVEKF